MDNALPFDLCSACSAPKIFTAIKKLDHHVQLNQTFRAGLERWFTFLTQWNGVLLLWDEEQPSVTLTSDA